MDGLSTMDLSSKTGFTPPQSRTVPGLFKELAARFPDREALVSTSARLTFAELYRDACAVAKGLHARGVRRGDKVAILMGNRPEWITTDIAICMLGATMVSVNTWVTSHELHYILEHSDTKVLVAGTRLRDIDYQAIMTEMECQLGRPSTLTEVVWQSGVVGCAFEAMVTEGRYVSDSVIEESMAAISP
jgi:fatty-acyl-CoA synthase